jgi:hypothetical protein
MFNIEEFKANFLGGARANKFVVEVPTLPNKARFLIKGTSIPAGELGEVIFRYQGLEAKFAGDRTVSDWSVSLVLDMDYAGFNELEAWHNLIKGNESGAGADNHNQYKKDCFVTCYSESGEEISVYKLVGCWPKTVPEIPLSWETTDSLIELDFTFSFDWKERIS